MTTLHDLSGPGGAVFWKKHSWIFTPNIVMNTNEFNEFWNLINTTSKRKESAYRMKKHGYIPLASDATPKKSSPYKPKKKTNKPKSKWDIKLEEYNRKLQERKNN